MGVMGADITAELAENERVRDEQATFEVADQSLQALVAVGPSGVPDVVAESGQALQQIIEDNPDSARIRGLVQNARSRIFRASQSTYLAGGARGELEFLIGVSNGDFDILGLDVIAKTVEGVADRRADLISELLTDAVLGEDYGPVENKGGRFPTYDNLPDTLELKALKAQAEDLPEFERDIVVRGLDALIERTRRRAHAANFVTDFVNEVIPEIPGFSQNPAAQAAFDDFFLKGIQPWLDSPEVEAREKTAFLQRTFLQLGVVPQSMQKWVLGQIRNANPNPEEALNILSIAKAFVAVDPLPLPGLQPLTKGKTPTSKLPDEWLSTSEKSLLRYMARHAVEGPLSASNVYSQYLTIAQDRGATKPSASLSATRDSEIAKSAKKDLRELTERIEELYGSRIDQVPKSLLDSYREILTAESIRLEGIGLTEEEIEDTAKDFAARQVLDANPPVKLFGRTFMDGPVYGLLEGGKYPVDSIEVEIVEAFKQVGMDPNKGDLLQRFRLIQEDGMDPNEFKILILGADGRPSNYLQSKEGEARFRFDGKNSVYQKTIEGARLIGLEEHFDHLESTEPSARLRKAFIDDLISSFFLTRDEFVNQYAGSNELAMKYTQRTAPPVQVGSLTFFDEKEAPQEVARKRRDNLFSRVESGNALFTVRPSLEEQWDREYEAKLKELSGRSIFGTSPMLESAGGGWRIAPWYSEEEGQEIAEKAANKAVLLELEHELGEASIADIMRFAETGLYPNEEGPAASPVRDPKSIEQLDLPEIPLEEAFNPSEILKRLGGK